MYDAILMHVRQRFADAACQLDRVPFGHRTDAVQQVRKRITPKVFGHYIWPAAVFLLQVNEFQDIWMIQAKPDLFLTLEPRVESRIALELHKRHLYRHCLFVSQVGGLEYCRHSAAADGFSD